MFSAIVVALVSLMSAIIAPILAPKMPRSGPQQGKSLDEHDGMVIVRPIMSRYKRRSIIPNTGRP